MSQPAPTPFWWPLFDHMMTEHRLIMVDSELNAIALKVDACRKVEKSEQPVSVPMPPTETLPLGTLEQNMAVFKSWLEQKYVVARQAEDRARTNRVLATRAATIRNILENFTSLIDHAKRGGK